jgi:hypothetical protein
LHGYRSANPAGCRRSVVPRAGGVAVPPPLTSVPPRGDGCPRTEPGRCAEGSDRRAPRRGRAPARVSTPDLVPANRSLLSSRLGLDGNGRFRSRRRLGCGGNGVSESPSDLAPRTDSRWPGRRRRPVAAALWPRRRNGPRLWRVADRGLWRPAEGPVAGCWSERSRPGAVLKAGDRCRQRLRVTAGLQRACNAVVTLLTCGFTLSRGWEGYKISLAVNAFIDVAIDVDGESRQP